MNDRNPLFGLLGLLACTATAALGQTITAAPDPTAPTLLHPSSGEVVQFNQLYTIEWTPSPPGPLAIELFGYNTDHLRQISRLLPPDGQECDGWLMNTECTKFNISVPEGATSYVWDLNTPEGFRVDYQYVRLTMGVYINTLENYEMPSSVAVWYVSSPFSIEKPPWTTTTTTTTTGTSTTSTTSWNTVTRSEEATTPTPTATNEIATETDFPTTLTLDSPTSSETPTDAGMSLTSGNLGIVLPLGCVTLLLLSLS